jgi:hypothetical protein
MDNEKMDREKTTRNLNPDDTSASEQENLDRTLEDSFPASDPPSSIPDPSDKCDDDKDTKKGDKAA